MENFFLEKPTINRKQEALDYLDENYKYNSDFNGVGSLYGCLEGKTYEECLLELDKRTIDNMEYLNKIDRCPSKTFFVVRDNDNKIVGMINVRYAISNEKLENGASHIGYGIRPTERRKGYAKIALYLGLLEEQKLGEARVLLNCDIDNIGSNKTILALGGELEKTELDESDGVMTNYYWIDIERAIEKNFEHYNPFIKE